VDLADVLLARGQSNVIAASSSPIPSDLDGWRSAPGRPDVILREASDKLAAASRDEAMDGYSKRTKARAWEIADAIWAALVSHSIAYVLPPQELRTPNANSGTGVKKHLER
jgi:hypothetical protein